MKTPLSFARLWLCAIAITACMFTQAQNLVVNPSFETTNGCPAGISEFYRATGWSQGNSGSDTCTTSDLYAGCSSSIGGANSPAGLLGTQPSRTGTHHAGIILQEGFVGCAALGSNYREYIQGQLSSPMVAGQKYVVKFYVSLPENVMWASDDIGVLLTNNQYTHNACPNNQLIPMTPQLNYCGPAIMDTVNWVEVKWIYTAVGGETFFTIGNFKSDANSNPVAFKCGSFNPYAYYYIDDVEVSALPAPGPNGPADCAFAVATSSTKTNCNASTGTANVLATGCTTPFNYVWSNSQSGVSASNLAAGNYTITVTDANNCSLSATVAVASHVPATVTVNAINASCGSSNGSAIAGASGGTAPYTYAWSNSQTGPTASNLGAGTYTVTVTSTGNCTASASGAVTAGSGGFSVTPSVTNASCGAVNGQATVTPSTPGTYTYLWSNGQTTQTATGLAAGNYTVTVTPGAGGTATAFFTEDFTAGVGGWTLNTAGPGTNGAVANQWIVNSDAECVCGSGNYLHITCGGTIFNGCPVAGECTYSTGFPPGFPIGGDVTTDKYAVSPVINTTGKTNMVLTFSYMVEGQTGTDYGQVAFSSDGGNTWTIMPTQYLNQLSCTQATVTIPNSFENQANFKLAFRWVNNTDADGDAPGFVVDNIQITSGGGTSCPAVTQVTVGSNGGLTMNLASTNAACGNSNGTATANVTAGTGPYTYAWSNGGANASTISGLGSGTYTVTVTGQGGCSATASTVVSATAGLSLAPNATNATCGNNNGTATATVTAGTGPYTYAWSNSASTQVLNNLGAGTYSVTVTGQGGCSATASMVVSATPGLTLNATATNAGCGAQGSATVNTTAGSGPFTYLWSNNATTQSITVNPGTYNVTVTGQGGCSATATATVAATAGLTASFTVTQPSCGQSNGSISAQNVSGTSPINVTWTKNGSNVGNTYNISNLGGGTYVFHAVDANGCDIDTSFVLNGGGGVGSVPLQISEDTLCSGDTAIICAPAGYTTYQWNNGATTQCIGTRFAGNYYVTVTDAGSCTASSIAQAVAVRPLPPVSVTVNGDTMTSFNAVSYQWFYNGGPIQGATSSQYIANQSGSYTVQITDINGCRATSNAIPVVVTGIDVVVLENMKVYPNPSALRGWFIEVDATLVGSTAEVYDYRGRLMYSSKLTDAKSEISFNAAQGVYVLKIVSGTKAVSQKIIKL